ncbi:hypothetical protein BC830DRAFT_1106714 [Chytriomyces sp. MP71]|nr:hypothetical protein BC830DRAFT_1106714 [Chytriomyces sp. MP71]
MEFSFAPALSSVMCFATTTFSSAQNSLDAPTAMRASAGVFVTSVVFEAGANVVEDGADTMTWTTAPAPRA